MKEKKMIKIITQTNKQTKKKYIWGYYRKKNGDALQKNEWINKLMIKRKEKRKKK